MHHHAHAHSRRDFFSRAFGGALAGASIVEVAFLRATWARAQAPGASANLFTIVKVADGVYAALARPQVLTNCNAAIFVNSQDVLVVDAHLARHQQNPPLNRLTRYERTVSGARTFPRISYRTARSPRLLVRRSSRAPLPP